MGDQVEMDVLSQSQQALLAREDPLFDGNYMEAAELAFVVRDKVLQAEQSLFSNPVHYSLNFGCTDDGLEKAKRTLKALHEVQTKVEQAFERRVEATINQASVASGTTLLPRMVRLLKGLNIDENQAKALQFLILHYTGAHFPPSSSTYHQRGMGRNLRLYARLNEMQYLEFMSPNSPLIKEGLVEVSEDEYEPDFNNIQFKIPSEVLKALSGATLTSDDYLKLDNTVLADLLAEEPGFSFDNLAKEAKPGEGGSRVTSASVSEDEMMDDSGDGASEGGGGATAQEGVGGGGGDGGTEGVVGKEGGGKDAAEEQEEIELGQLLQEVEATAAAVAANEKIRKDRSESTGTTGTNDGKQEDKKGEITAYTTDLEYLEDWFAVVLLRLKMFATGIDDGEANYYKTDKRTPELILRELKAKLRHAVRKREARLQMTENAGGWMPRLVMLARRRGYTDFEAEVIVSTIGAVLSQDVRMTMLKEHHLGLGGGQFYVGTVLGMCFNGSLSDQVTNRRTFYRNAPLIRDGIIRLSERKFGDGSDLIHCFVSVDRRMLDFCAGLDTELADLIEGGHCYTPSVLMENVVLPESQKKRICDTVLSFEKFRQVRKSIGFDDVISYGRGLVLLFHGPPGTGKTMMANAVAKMLRQKVVLITPSNPALGSDTTLLRAVFREALLVKAVLVFDECETVFGSRDRGNTSVHNLLVEIERFDGIVILCTNRPSEIDVAMHRRITLAMPFQEPEPRHRETIWRNHMPATLSVDEGVDLGAIANEYDLNGGFIKNAVLTAVASAVCRDENNILVNQEDLASACAGQARSQIGTPLFDEDSTKVWGKAKPSLDELVVPKEMRRRLRAAATFEKNRRSLAVGWGFGDDVPSCCVVISGPQGCGKNRAAEALALAVDRKVQRFPFGRLMAAAQDMNGKWSVKTLFKDAQNAKKVVVIENAGMLLMGEKSDDDHESCESGLALAHLGAIRDCVCGYTGVVVLLVTTRVTGSAEGLMRAVANSLWVLWHVPLPALDRDAREKLWHQSLPMECQLLEGEEPDCRRLSELFPTFGGRQIRNVLCKAAAKALGSGKALGMKQLQSVAEEELERGTAGDQKTMMFL